MESTMISPALAKARTQLLMSGARGAFYGTLALSLVPVARDDIPTAATDGKRFFYNPNWFETLSERQRVGVLVHEILHPLMCHHTRRNGRHHDGWNIAADYAINPGIVSDGFELPAGALIDSQYAGLSSEQIYRIREIERQEQNQESQNKPGEQGDESGEQGSGEQGDDESDKGADDDSGEQGDQGPGADDSGQDGPEGAEGNAGAEGGPEGAEGAAERDNKSGAQDTGQAGNGASEAGKPGKAAPISDPGKCGGIMDAAPDCDPTEIARAESDMQQRFRQAIAVARKANGGTLPGDLARLAGELNQPKLDSRDLLRRFIDRSITKSYAWTRPNRRYLAHGLTLPSLISDRPGHIVAIVDVSGSLWSQAAQAALTSELQGALDSGAADRVTVAYADTEITGHAEYNAGDTIAIEGSGGGGTDFRAPLQWVADNCEDVSAIMYLTDMQTCDYGAAPESPLLWIVYGDPRQAAGYVARAPFGEAVYLD
jgi:predicted metal-dependent peptidase